jgi:hypothetical protein
MNTWVVVAITAEDECTKFVKMSKDRALEGTSALGGRQRKNMLHRQVTIRNQWLSNPAVNSTFFQSRL